MKEFMTQSEVVNEFVSFLTTNGLLEKYKELIESRVSHSSNKYLDMLRESNDIGEYLHKLTDSDEIIDLKFITSTPNSRCKDIDCEETSSFFAISEMFITQFNKDHKEEIIDTIGKARKLLIRYIKENERKKIIEYYGSTENAMKDINKFGTKGQLLSDIPFTVVLPLFGIQHRQSEIEAWSRINKKFKKYYIENIKNGND